MTDKKVRMAPELQHAQQATTQALDAGDRDVKAEQAAKGHDLEQQQKRQAEQKTKDALANLAAKEEAKEAQLAANDADRKARTNYLQTPLCAAETEELQRLEKQAMGNRNVEPETMHRLSDLRVRSRAGAGDPGA